MANRIINANIGIPTPFSGTAVAETAAGSNIWVLGGVNLASTSAVLSISGGTSRVTVEGSLFSTGSVGISLGTINNTTTGKNTLLIGEGATISSLGNGINALSGQDAITVAGQINAGGLGVLLRQITGLTEGNSQLVITETGVVQAGTVGITDGIGGNAIDVLGTVSGKTEGMALGAGSFLTVGDTGRLSGATGLNASAGTNSILNDGMIRGTVTGVTLGNGSNLTNGGTITGTSAIDASAGGARITNAGLIDGTIDGNGDGNRLINLGQINDSVFLGGANARVVNRGEIAVENGLGVSLGNQTDPEGVARLLNTGNIFAGATAIAASGMFQLVNTGDIDGDKRAFVQVNAVATSLFENHGRIGHNADVPEILFSSTEGGAVRMVNHEDGVVNGGVESQDVELTLINKGTIDGSVLMDQRNDSFDGRGGTVTGGVNGGAGDDRLISGSTGENLGGGAGDDLVVGNDGDDVLSGEAGLDDLRGGAGNDLMGGGTDADSLQGNQGDDTFVFEFEDGNDIYDGGLGIDTLIMTEGVGNLNINLATASASSANTGLDVVQNVENAIGGDGADSITGDEGANLLGGGAGADTLTGDEGRDLLEGGAGADRLLGGTGRDVMAGGAGGDVFVFNTLAESGLTARDVITDFTDFTSGLADRDKINLSAIDANSSVAGDQAFVSIAQGAFVAGSSAGKLHFVQVGGNTVLEMEVNNDGIADMAIVLHGLHTITSSDYIL